MIDFYYSDESGWDTHQQSIFDAYPQLDTFKMIFKFWVWPMSKFYPEYRKGKKTMKNIFDRLITAIVFLVSVTLGSCIVGLMTRGNHAETPWWFLAGIGLLAAAASIGACMWGVKNDHD